MRRSWAVATVGALGLIVAVASYLLIKLTAERQGSGKGYIVWALFDDAAGLFEKSRVQTAGISVGQIEKRELDPQTGKAKVTVRLQDGFAVWSNGLVAKKSASLLGEFYLEIDPGTAGGRDREGQMAVQLKDGDQIKRVTEPVGMGQIMDQIGVTLPVLKQILEDVRVLTSGPITEIAENVNTLINKNSEVLERLLGRVDNIAAGIEGITTSESENVKVAIQNVRDITESIKSLVGTSGSEVTATGTAVRDSLQKLQGTVDALDRTMKNVEKVTARLEKGEGTAGRLLADDTIARNIEDITSDAGTFVRGITKLQTIVGLRTEYNFLAKTFKNYVSIQLMPRPDKFYLFELVDDPRGFQEFESKTVKTQEYECAVPGDPSTCMRVGPERRTETTASTVSERLKFTFQFGKRVGPLTGRFGIKESTGGVGLDLHLLGDRLLLSTDLFDAAAWPTFERTPRLQVRASYALYRRNWFLITGLDDLLNPQKRLTSPLDGKADWFFGTQLVFNDEDLKTLLLFGGGAVGSAAGK